MADASQRANGTTTQRRQPVARPAQRGAAQHGAGPQRKVDASRLKAQRYRDTLNGISEVLPFLFISGAQAAHDSAALEAFNITHVVNATQGEPNDVAGVTYLRVPVPDAPSADLTRWWKSASSHLEHARRGSSCCLVHCTHGQSRSVSLVLAYLVTKQRMPLADAFNLVKRQRCVAAPNSGFMTQLCKLEIECGLRPSVDCEHYAATGKVRTPLVLPQVTRPALEGGERPAQRPGAIRKVQGKDAIQRVQGKDARNRKSAHRQ